MIKIISSTICPFVQRVTALLEQKKIPSLRPSADAETRAIDRAWSRLATSNYMTQCSAQRSEDEKTLCERTEKLGNGDATCCDQIEKRCGNGSCC